MKKIYYQLIWYFMQLPWPVRILVELSIYLLLITLLIQLIKKVDRKFRIKKILGKIFIYLGTWFIARVGRKYTWGNAIDKKIIDVGRKFANTPFSVHPILNKLVWIGLIMCYLLCVIPDTKAFSYFDGEFAKCFLNTKDFFVKYEEKWSSGYLAYAPVVPTMENSTNKKVLSSKEILIKVKKKKRIYIYQKPSSNAKKLLKVKGKGKIVYKNRIKKGKKGYWVMVFIPSKKVTGWMKSSCIKENIWKKIKGK